MKRKLIVCVLILSMILSFMPSAVFGAGESKSDVELVVEISDKTVSEMYSFFSLNESKPYNMPSCAKPAIEAAVKKLGGGVTA